MYLVLISLFQDKNTLQMPQSSLYLKQCTSKILLKLLSQSIFLLETDKHTLLTELLVSAAFAFLSLVFAASKSSLLFCNSFLSFYK